MRSGAEIRPDHVAIYIRWSTDDQTDGTTLAVQQEGCQHYVLSQGWCVTPALIFVDDGYSGGTLDRPKLRDLRLAVEAGQVDCVVVYKLDRLSRSVIDTVNLALDEWENRTYIKSAREPIDTTTPMGKQFFYMLVSYAEWERSVIRERTYSGKIKRAKQGHYWGGVIPFGYRHSGEPGMLQVDPEQAEIVRQIFQRYRNEVGTLRIAGELNEGGIPGPGGRQWRSSSIQKMLHNPIYAGLIRSAKRQVNPRHQRDKSETWYINNPNPVEAPSLFPGIIPMAEFERVQTLFASRRPPKTGVRALRSEHLLTGLLRCACGSAMVGQITRGDSGRYTYTYYACKNKGEQGRSACRSGVIPQCALNQVVEDKLQELLYSREAYDNCVTLRWAGIEAQLRQTEAQRRQVSKMVESLNDQARQVNRDYRSGVLDATLYNENRQAIDAASAQLKEQLVYLERMEQSLAEQLRERDGTNEIFDLARRWAEITIRQRKLVLRHLLHEVVAARPPRAKDLNVRVIWKFGSEAAAVTGPPS